MHESASAACNLSCWNWSRKNGARVKTKTERKRKRERERERERVWRHAREFAWGRVPTSTLACVCMASGLSCRRSSCTHTHTHRCVCSCTQVCLCQCVRAHGRTTADFAKLLTTIPSTLVDSTTPHISLTCAQPDTRAAMIIPSFPRTLERKFSSANKTLQTCRVRECVFMCVRCVCV